MAFPNLGQTQAASATRMQVGRPKGPTATPRITGYGGGGLGSGSPLMGGGGMAVGPLRTNRGQPRHPSVTVGAKSSVRASLLKGMKG